MRNGYAAYVHHDAEFPPYKVEIRIDANNLPVERYVMHELLHVVLSELVRGKFDDTMEEVLIVALDTDLWNYVSKSKPRLARWKKTVERKIQETIDKRPDTSHDELVNRPAD